jgi:hypothetical protein
MKFTPLRLATRLFRAAMLSQLVSFCLIPAYANTTDPDSAASWQGDWEVTRVLMTDGMQPQWSMREDDPRLMARTLHLGPDGVRFRNTDFNCSVLQTSDQPQALRSLFSKSAASTKRPPSIHGTLYGRAHDYELGSLKGRAIQLLEVHCKPDSHNLVAEANWLALTIPPSASSAALLMPYQPDTLLVLRRTQPGAHSDAAQASYCVQATSASDKAICADRQLWRMYTYTLSALQRAHSPRPEINEALTQDVAEQLQKRQACQGNTQCLYEVLDRHIELLVQRW